MENSEIHYKTLCEQALLTLTQKEESLEEKQAQLTEKEELIVEKEQLIFKYRAELDKLLKIIFGPKKDLLKTSGDTVQLDLFSLGVSESDQAKTGPSDEENTEEESTPKRKKREKGQGRRMSLPETLRREDVFIEPTDSTEACVVIGEEVTEVIKTISTRSYANSYLPTGLTIESKVKSNT